jgi:RimJ/RimL family protein N-acetyltransferase
VGFDLQRTESHPRDSIQPEAVLLPSGLYVAVAPIGPGDEELIRDGFSRLSPRSRYLRFMTPMVALSAAEVEYLTHVDQVDHVAWGARDLDTPGWPGVGVARYVRLPDDPTLAEAAVTVVDSHQRRGLGTWLLGRLAHSARSGGVETFRAWVLEENTAMVGLLERLGGSFVFEEGGVVRVDLPVPPLRSLPPIPDG